MTVRQQPSWEDTGLPDIAQISMLPEFACCLSTGGFVEFLCIIEPFR